MPVVGAVVSGVGTGGVRHDDGITGAEVVEEPLVALASGAAYQATVIGQVHLGSSAQVLQNDQPTLYFGAIICGNIGNGVDVVAPSLAISDDPESFRAGLIQFFRPWA